MGLSPALISYRDKTIKSDIRCKNYYPARALCVGTQAQLHYNITHSEVEQWS